MNSDAIPPTEYILSLRLKKSSLLNLLIRPNETTTLDPRKPKAETRLHYTAHDIGLLRILLERPGPMILHLTAQIWCSSVTAGIQVRSLAGKPGETWTGKAGLDDSIATGTAKPSLQWRGTPPPDQT